MSDIKKLKLNNVDYDINSEYSKKTTYLRNGETSTCEPIVLSGDSPIVTEYYISKKIEVKEDTDSLYIYIS